MDGGYTNFGNFGMELELGVVLQLGLGWGDWDWVLGLGRELVYRVCSGCHGNGEQTSQDGPKR